MNTARDNKGMRLGKDACWVVESISDFEKVFRNLYALLAGVECFLYFEGVSCTSKAAEYLKTLIISSPTAIYPGTIWPKPQIFHVMMLPDTLTHLAELSAHCAGPEIADHFHVYSRNQMILQWYDSCDPESPILLAECLAEEKVAQFAMATGSAYKRYKQS